MGSLGQVLCSLSLAAPGKAGFHSPAVGNSSLSSVGTAARGAGPVGAGTAQTPLPTAVADFPLSPWITCGSPVIPTVGVLYAGVPGFLRAPRAEELIPSGVLTCSMKQLIKSSWMERAQLGAVLFLDWEHCRALVTQLRTDGNPGISAEYGLTLPWHNSASHPKIPRQTPHCFPAGLAGKCVPTPGNAGLITQLPQVLHNALIAA